MSKVGRGRSAPGVPRSGHRAASPSSLFLAVYRIHSVLHGFIPFFQKFRLIGNVHILPLFTLSLPTGVFCCK